MSSQEEYKSILGMVKRLFLESFPLKESAFYLEQKRNSKFYPGISFDAYMAGFDDDLPNIQNALIVANNYLTKCKQHNKIIDFRIECETNMIDFHIIPHPPFNNNTLRIHIKEGKHESQESNSPE